MSFVRVAAENEIKPDTIHPCRAGSTSIVLVNAGGQICAYEDRCVHLGVRLSEGELSGTTITCAAHGWTYEACTGEGINPSGVRLARVPVKVEDGSVFVDAGRLLRKLPTPPPLDSLAVGPVFEAGPIATAAIEAMRELNPELSVVDRGSYLRVSALGKLKLTRAGFEVKIQEVEFPRDVQAAMVSFVGIITVEDDQITWTLPGVEGAR